MKIVVAGASGNVGYRTAERLLEGGVFPVLIARNTHGEALAGPRCAADFWRI